MIATSGLPVLLFAIVGVAAIVLLWKRWTDETYREEEEDE